MIHRVEQRIGFGGRARIQRFFHLVKAVDAMLSRGFDNGEAGRRWDTRAQDRNAAPCLCEQAAQAHQGWQNN